MRVGSNKRRCPEPSMGEPILEELKGFLFCRKGGNK